MIYYTYTHTFRKMLSKAFKQYLEVSPSLCSLSLGLPRYINEASLHLKHVHLKPAIVSIRLAVPSKFIENKHSYAYFPCQPKGKFGGKLKIRRNC